jgi:hypothetical protein
MNQWIKIAINISVLFGASSFAAQEMPQNPVISGCGAFRVEAPATKATQRKWMAAFSASELLPADSSGRVYRGRSRIYSVPVIRTARPGPIEFFATPEDALRACNVLRNETYPESSYPKINLLFDKSGRVTGSMVSGDHVSTMSIEIPGSGDAWDPNCRPGSGVECPQQ